MKSWRGVLGLIVWIWIALSAGLTGSRFTPGAWYDGLVKPAWTPPDAVFPVVWTLLYVAMGVAAFRVWRRRGLGGAPVALGLWLLQLVLNTVWSWLFFGRHAMGAALFDLTLLWAAVLAVTLAFRRHDRPAAWLMVPYLVWAAFAWALNLAVWRLNA